MHEKHCDHSEEVRDFFSLIYAYFWLVFLKTIAESTQNDCDNEWSRQAQKALLLRSAQLQIINHSEH